MLHLFQFLFALHSRTLALSPIVNINGWISSGLHSAVLYTHSAYTLVYIKFQFKGLVFGVECLCCWIYAFFAMERTSAGKKPKVTGTWFCISFKHTIHTYPIGIRLRWMQNGIMFILLIAHCHSLVIISNSSLRVMFNGECDFENYGYARIIRFQHKHIIIIILSVCRWEFK